MSMCVYDVHVCHSPSVLPCEVEGKDLRFLPYSGIISLFVC